MRKIIVMILFILPMLSNAETDKQAALRQLVEKRDGIIYKQASDCRGLSNIVFLVSSLKDTGYNYSQAKEKFKDYPDKITEMVDGVYTNHFSTGELIKYSDKFYFDCIEAAKKDMVLP